jgi:hypothetical protein
MAEIVGEAGGQPQRQHEIHQNQLGDVRRLHGPLRGAVLPPAAGLANGRATERFPAAGRLSNIASYHAACRDPDVGGRGLPMDGDSSFAKIELGSSR